MLTIYLAGPYGFYKFNGSLDCYGSYKIDEKGGAPEGRGLILLNRLEHDLNQLGYKTFNPWFDTLHPSFFSGVVFGQGIDEDNSPWIYGSLKERSLKPELFEKWIQKLSIALKTDYLPIVSPFEDYDLASTAYESIVRKEIYSRCIMAAIRADITFADFNSYRGCVDIGTFMETNYALHYEKNVILLLDESAEIGEGNAPLPLMIDGWIRENNLLVTNKLDSFVAYLKHDFERSRLSLHTSFISRV